MNLMRNIFLAALLAAALAGCAATAYKQARANANQVTNGMNMAEVVQILGIPPSAETPEYAYWRRGNAQSYNGTAQGAIRFNFVDGKVVGVPEGGVFGETAAKQFQTAREKKQREEADAIMASIAAEKAQKATMVARERAAEEAAIPNSFYICGDKETCTKVFALAQIYVAQNADQKIQVATDTIIQTYNATETGNISMSVIKTPKQGSTEIVSVTPICKLGATPEIESYCRVKRTKIYAGFRPFVDSQLSK